MAMTPTAQHEEFYRRAKAAGYTDAEIAAKLNERAAREKSGIPTPKEQAPSLTQGPAPMGGFEQTLRGGLEGLSQFSRGVFALPKVLGLPPIGGQALHDQWATGERKLMSGTGAPAREASTVTNIAASVPLGFARAPQVVANAGRLLFGRATPVVETALKGAGGGAIGNPDDPLAGSIIGAPTGVVGAGLGKLLRGTPSSIPAGSRRAENIPLSAGQGADLDTLSGNMVAGVERGLTFAPWPIGTGVQKQRERAATGLREHAFGETHIPQQYTQMLPPYQNAPRVPGQDPAKWAAAQEAEYSRIYNDALAGKTFTGMHHFVNDAMGSMRGHAHLPPGPRKKIEKDLNEWLSDTIARNQGRMSGEEVAKLRNHLSYSANYYKGQPNPTDKARGAAYERALTTLDNQYLANQYPDVKQVYDDLAPGYAKLQTVKAAAEEATAGGQFTPGGLAQTSTQRLGATHPLSETSRSVHELAPGGRNFAPIYTAAAGYPLILGASQVFRPGEFGTPEAAGLGAGAGVLGLFGTETGQRILQGGDKRQKAIARFLRRQTPAAGVAGGMLVRPDEDVSIVDAPLPQQPQPFLNPVPPQGNAVY